jgi:DNA modification methylase
MIQFIHGDAVEEMRKMPDGSVDLVLTDMPAPIHGVTESDGVTRAFLNEVLVECLRVSRGPVVTLGIPLIQGWSVHIFQPVEDYHMFWFQPVRTPKGRTILSIPVYVWRGSNANQGTYVLMAADGSLLDTHPGAKPTALMGQFLDLFHDWRPGALVRKVLDPFCGIGATALACQERGLSFTGIDIDAEYIRIASGRVNPAKEAA